MEAFGKEVVDHRKPDEFKFDVHVQPSNMQGRPGGSPLPRNAGRKMDNS
jgi:hypothetical protein